MKLLRLRTIVMVLFFLIFLCSRIGSSQDFLVDNAQANELPKNVVIKEEIIDADLKAGDFHEPRSFNDFIKGEKARNAVLLGMWSEHFKTKKDYRKTHNLVGIQYNGYFAGTFANSHSDQVYTIGIARTVIKRELRKPLLFEAGYKLGPMYGYREGIKHIDGFSILPVVAFGLSYHHIGIDLNFVPGNAFSWNMRINF